jgi:glycosyltransferase involved in cell wall biosynthesis
MPTPASPPIEPVAGPKRIFYIESAAVPGGSTESLLQLVAGLDRAAWAPEVVTFVDSPALARLAALNVPAQSLNIARPATWTAGQVAEQAKTLGVVQRLRQVAPGRRLYHGAGFLLKFARHTLPQARRLATLIRQRGADLVHTNIRVGYDHIGLCAAILAGRPVVAHVRDWDPLGPLERCLLSYISRLIYISQAIAADHRRQGVAAAQGVVVPNALDLSAYHPLDPTERAALRTEFGWPTDAWLVGLIGRGDTWKGHPVLLQALARLQVQGHSLPAHLPPLRALIVGAPGPQSTAYWAEVQQQAQALGLGSIVHFAGQRHDVPRILGALDLCVHCSTTPEPFGRVLIEAGAARLPVVAANAGGVPEIVRPGETGLLVPPGDPQALADAICQLYTAPATAAAFGTAAHRHIAANFNLPDHVAAIETIYRQVLAEQE